MYAYRLTDIQKGLIQMTIERCKELVPVWAASDPYQDKTEWKPRPTWDDRFHNFKRRNGLALILVMIWGLSLFLACAITATVVRNNTAQETEDRVRSEMRRDFQNYLDQLNEEASAAAFLTGDASFEAAVEALAEPMSYVIATYAQDYSVTQEGQKTIGWVFCGRSAKNSTEFGKTPQEILEKANAWEGKVVGHARRPQDIELAREIARDFLKGSYPDGYTTDLTFFTREAGGKIIARNEFYTGPYTTYWWWGK